jgi:hypothetical protein
VEEGYSINSAGVLRVKEEPGRALLVFRAYQVRGKKSGKK